MRLSEAIELIEQLPAVRFVHPMVQFEVAAVDDYHGERPDELPHRARLASVA